MHLLLYFIFNKSDASIKHTIVTFPENDNLTFTLGIPFAGVHIEESGNLTDYADFIEIWYNDYGSYVIAIRGLGSNFNNDFHWHSDIKKAIIFYI